MAHIFIESLFKTENYCFYLTEGFHSEISQGELASYFFVYCQNLAFINYRHVYGSRISFSYLRNLPNSAPQWEHLCTQSLALGTQKGMAKHPSHNLQRILNYQVLKRKILNDKILIHVVITWKHLTKKKKIMRVKQQITHFNLIGSPFKSGFLSKHCGPNVKVQKK